MEIECVWRNHSITNEVHASMTQGVLPFQYEVSAAACGMTALAGLPAYMDLAAVSGLTGAIGRPLKVGAEQRAKAGPMSR